MSACLNRVGTCPRRELLAGVFSFKEKAQPAIAGLVRRFEFRAPSERAHERTTNRSVCRETLRAAGFARPETMVCRSGEAVDQAFAGLSRRHRRLILKSMTGYGFAGLAAFYGLCAMWLYSFRSEMPVLVAGKPSRMALTSGSPGGHFLTGASVSGSVPA
ncbi:hypothetical protein AAFG07_33075 [Bradyrhizobium sp. B097]|uniref:hypothetical protein n=1 Tax=Bradyrhizobium sp. B097 TaxID=3140244 RepID=UPI00318343B0